MSIVGTNDLHGGVAARDGRGGLAMLGGYLRNLRAARARDGGAVLLLDGGDMFQGTMESNLREGAPVVAAYNALGYTAAAVGNHEFDFGPVGPAATPRNPGDDPQRRAEVARRRGAVPVSRGEPDRSGAQRAGGLAKRPADRHRERGRPARGHRRGHDSGALTATIAANVTRLAIAPLTETIRTHATALRAQGARGRDRHGARRRALHAIRPSRGPVVVRRERRDLRGRARAARRAGGRDRRRSHARGIGHQVAGIPITEAHSNGRAFGRIDLSVDRASKKVVGKRSFPPVDLVPGEYEGAPVVPDAAIERVLAPSIEAVRSSSHVPSADRRTGDADPPAVAACLRWDNCSATRCSRGRRAPTSRSTTPAAAFARTSRGPLIFNSVYEVMPFDNIMVRIRLTGAQLRQVFANYIPRGRVLGFSGVRVRADCSSGTPKSR